MRTSRSWFLRIRTASALSAQVALAVLGAVACSDLDSLGSVSGTTSSIGGAGQGGTSTVGTTATGGTTAMGGTTATGGTTAMGGAGGASTGGTGGAVANMVPDFSLVDVNPNSMSSGQPVSPRDYLQRVSAWYFGHST